MSEMSDMTAAQEELGAAAQMEGGEEMPSGMMEGDQDGVETGRTAEVHGDLVLEEMPASEM